MIRTRKIINEMSQPIGITHEKSALLQPYLIQLQKDIAGGHWEQSLEDFVAERVGDLDIVEEVFPEVNQGSFWAVHGAVVSHLVGLLRPHYRREVVKESGGSVERIARSMLNTYLEDVGGTPDELGLYDHAKSYFRADMPSEIFAAAVKRAGEMLKSQGGPYDNLGRSASNYSPGGVDDPSYGHDNWKGQPTHRPRRKVHEMARRKPLESPFANIFHVIYEFSRGSHSGDVPSGHYLVNTGGGNAIKLAADFHQQQNRPEAPFWSGEHISRYAARQNGALPHEADDAMIAKTMEGIDIPPPGGVQDFKVKE